MSAPDLDMGEKLECKCPQHGTWYGAASIDKMVRDIDVAINGEEGAAKQAMLCDVFGQIIEVAATARRGVEMQERLTDCAETLDNAGLSATADELRDYLAALAPSEQPKEER